MLALGFSFSLQAQNSKNEILVSEVAIENITAKLTEDNGKKLFQITVKDEDHSCVVDYCGIYYSEKDKDYSKNIETLSNNLKDIYKTLGDVEKCAVLKWEGKDIKFTVYGIAPDVAYICVDGHGHGTISKEGVKMLYSWMDSLEHK